MARERLHLHTVFGVDRQRRWTTGVQNNATERFVTVGQLADKRWFVDDSKDPKGAQLCRDERDAFDLADKIMARVGEWRRCPAAFDGLNQPIEAGWRRSGHWWLRDDEGKAEADPHGEGE